MIPVHRGLQFRHDLTREGKSKGRLCHGGKSHSCAHIWLLGLGMSASQRGNYFMYLYNVKLMIIFLPRGEVKKDQFLFPRRGWENSLGCL